MNHGLKNRVLEVLLWPDRFLAKTFIGVIRLYQKTFSPDHGPIGQEQPFFGCKFYPSCSNYGIATLQQRGFFAGMSRVVWRILRCHPWAEGGIDEPK